MTNLANDGSFSYREGLSWQERPFLFRSTLQYLPLAVKLSTRSIVGVALQISVRSISSDHLKFFYKYITLLFHIVVKLVMIVILVIWNW